MKAFDRDPVPVGDCHPRTSTIPWRGFLDLTRERRLPERTCRSTRKVSLAPLGRQRPFGASGSSRWPDLVAESVTHLRVPPSPNVKFRGTADSRPRNWPRSGIGTRRHSPAESERLQPVSSRLPDRDRPVCSVRSRSQPDLEMTVSAALQSVSRMGGCATSDRYQGTADVAGGQRGGATS